MPETTSFPSGTPSWADHLSHNGQAAKDFYTSLFGWTYDDHPAGPDMVYTHVFPQRHGRLRFR